MVEDNLVRANRGHCHTFQIIWEGILQISKGQGSHCSCWGWPMLPCLPSGKGALWGDGGVYKWIIIGWSCSLNWDRLSVYISTTVVKHKLKTKLDHSIGLFDKNSEPPKDKTKTFIGKGQTFVFKFIIVKMIIVLGKISAGADRGSCSQVRACLTLRSAPHWHQRKFFGAHVCRVTLKHVLQPLRSHIRSFGTLGQLLKIPPFSAHSAGGRGVPQFLGGLESFYF